MFPFTYAHYLKIERGGCLPKPAALAVMLKLLRQVVSAQERGALVRNYLREMCGDVRVYEDLFAPLLAPTGAPAPENALRLALGRLTKNITPAQLQAIASSLEATGCFTLLSNVPDALACAKISRLLGVTEARCLRAIKALQKQKVLVARGKDLYACAIPMEQRFRLPDSCGLEALYDEMLKNIELLAGKRTEALYGRSSPIRLTASGRDRLVHDLEEVFSLGASLSQKMVPAGPETPLYFIEASVRRLVVFPPDVDADDSRSS